MIVEITKVDSTLCEESFEITGGHGVVEEWGGWVFWDSGGLQSRLSSWDHGGGSLAGFACRQIGRLATRLCNLHEWMSKVVDIAFIARSTQVVVFAHSALVPYIGEVLPLTVIASTSVEHRGISLGF
jgi:hypothetical protein